MASSLPENCCSAEPVLWLETASSRDVFTKPWRHFCTQQLLNTHWNHMVFPSSASDRRKEQTSPCNINAIFLQKSCLCCTAQETDRNYLLNLSNVPIISCCKDSSTIKTSYYIRSLYTAFFLAQTIKKSKPTNRSDTDDNEVLMILGPASENFTLLISQSTSSLPCQTPAHWGKTVQLPKRNQIKLHTALL